MVLSLNVKNVDENANFIKSIIFEIDSMFKMLNHVVP